MIITKQDLEGFHHLQRLNLVNSIKPGNLVGTVSAAGITNLAVFSSVVHLGSHPALIGLIVRPAGDVRRHTYENIQATSVYTINHIPRTMTAPAHLTSAKFPAEVSEFEACGFTEEYLDGFAAPFVAESRLKFGLRLVKEIPIELNNTTLLIGEVENIVLPPDLPLGDGQLNLESLESAGISGLNTYYGFQTVGRYSYARSEDAPLYKRDDD